MWGAQALLTRWWPRELLGFLVLCAMFVVINSAAISQAQFEASDFAANSLLVEEAKNISLLTGHYSRFGFYHPGPAFLYVLAAGDWLFSDVTHLAPSPFSGQLIAVAALNSFFVIGTFHILRRILRWPGAAFIATGITLLGMVFLQNQIPTGMWFPFLYCLPFALLVLSLGASAAGKAWALPWAVLATGFLIHGHATFIPVTGMLWIIAIVINVALSSGGNRSSRIFTRTYAATHRVWLISSAALAALFVLPIAVLTLRDPPGPFGDYLFTDRASAPRGLVDVWNFVVYFWGGIFGLIGGLIVLIALILFSRGRALLALRASAAVVLGAALSMVIYAAFIVDDLANLYLGFFAFALPAITAALLAARLLLALRVKPGRFITIPIGAVIFGLALVFSNQTQFPADYNQAVIPQLAERTSQLAGGQPAVLDLDPSENWGQVWSLAMGMAAYADREGVDLFCVNENWFIGFTEDLRCTPEEVAAYPRLRLLAGPKITFAPAN